MYEDHRKELIQTIRVYLSMYKVSKLENYLDSAVRVMKQLKELNEQNQAEYGNLVALQSKRDELRSFLDNSNNTITYLKIA